MASKQEAMASLHVNPAEQEGDKGGGRMPSGIVHRLAAASCLLATRLCHPDGMTPEKDFKV